MIPISFILAYILTIMPMPEWLSIMRPEWVILILIYWCITAPERIGIGMGWFSGLLLDVLCYGILGQQALTFCIITFLILKLYRRIRVAPLWQQAFSVFFLIVIHLAISLWIRGITGQPPSQWHFWLPAFSTMLLWPVLINFLPTLQRQFGFSK